jgi:hypothetical protein
VAPQLMPPLPITVPVPTPTLLTVTVKVCSVNVAVTVVACASVISHVGEVPVQPPIHPVNTEPTAGSAVSVTTVSGGKSSAHVVPQSMPPTDDVTVPPPLPASVTVRSTFDGASIAASVGMSIGTSANPGASAR